ncbi:MAG: hypothetical protein V4751_11580 [Pseudomonadota bacterium]
MFIEVSAEHQKHIHSRILPKLSESEIANLFRFFGTIWLEGTEGNRSQGAIKKELNSAAKEIEKGLSRLEKLIAERGASLEAINVLDFHYSDANNHDMTMVNLSISEAEASGTVHSLRKIVAAIKHQAQDLETEQRQGRPQAERYKHLLLAIMLWFDRHQSHYRPSATQESPFVIFITYLLADVLGLGISDPRRHVANALEHFNHHLAKTKPPRHKTPRK